MKHPNFKGEVYIHVLPPSATLMDGRKVEVGKELKASLRNNSHVDAIRKTKYETHWLSYKNILPKLCDYGMHAIVGDRWYPYWWLRDDNTAWEDRFYAIPAIGNWICVVRVWGQTSQDDEKIVGLRRKVLHMRQIHSVKQLEALWKWGPNQDTVDWVCGFKDVGFF